MYLLEQEKLIMDDFYRVKQFQPKVPDQFGENYWRVHSLRDKLVQLHRLLFEIKSQMEIHLDMVDELPEGKDLLDFALENEDEKAQWFVFTSLLDRLLNDFCHYTYFGLIAIHPAHIAPSYTLLRKPYEQTLPILEWAMTNTGDFLEAFIKNVADIDTKFLSNRDQRNKQKRIDARKKVTKLLEFPFKELLEQIGGVDHFDNSAHLVTTRRNAATENMNMNFIFLNEDSQLAEDHTDYLIYMNAIYLAYSNVVFLALVKSIDVARFTKSDDFSKLLESLDMPYSTLHSYALMLMVLLKGKEESPEIINLFNLYAEAMEVTCPSCSANVKIDDVLDLQVFADYETLHCAECGKIIIYNESFAVPNGILQRLHAWFLSVKYNLNKIINKK